MFIPALVSHCELSKWAGPEVGYLFLEEQPRQRTDVWRRRNKRPKSEGAAGEEKKEMRGGEEEKKPEAFSLWIGYLLFANKVGWEGFKLAEGLPAKQLHQRLPPVAQVFLALLLLLWIQPGMRLGHHGKAVLSPFPVKHLSSPLCLALSQAGERPTTRNCCQMIPVTVAWSGRGGVGINQNIHMAKPSLTLSPLMPSAPTVPAAPGKGNKTPC